jgi:hypothetical protein
MTMTMKALELVLNNSHDMLDYLKSRFPVFHLSNIFFRDVHYGVMAFLKEKGTKVTYPAGEKIATALMEKLERERIVVKLDHQTWAVRHEKFKTPVTKQPAPSAKPAAASAPARPTA